MKVFLSLQFFFLISIITGTGFKKYKQGLILKDYINLSRLHYQKSVIRFYAKKGF
ncbi:hypothetical protein QFZ37_003377 [Chryseobacterium ginsenosidimutans]|uniref:hypothetical protein n=1 Tax=Chryseobacterium ginsenosidimutans TaxID=687846 RepID=UPI002787ABEB|nr:hypothetical protein [Chryseobacterium ginsenosidimutans]MDQ0595008.1 hypothetical protein [Chryseobacterium ginsenosidimutans]